MFKALNGWRFIFALMIVLHHMPLKMPLGLDFGNPIVTFFFILSGFVLTHSYRERILNNVISSRDFIVRRCSTIFPLQWLFTILFVLCTNVVTYWAIPFHLTLTQSFVPFWQIYFSLNTPSWFLSSLFFCYLLTPCIIRISCRREVFFILFLLYVALWHSFLYFLPDTIGVRWLCYINPFARLQNYCMGVLLALYRKDIVNALRNTFGTRKGIHTLLEMMAIGLMCICVMPSLLNLGGLLGIGSILLDCILCLFIIIYSIPYGLISQGLSFPIFDKLGRISITIFMSHGFVLHNSASLLEISKIVYVVVTFATVLLFSYLLEKYYCRNMSNMLLRFFNK